MTSTEMSEVTFVPPENADGSEIHHAEAASRNVEVATMASERLRDALAGSADIEHILLKAAAGAGKSFVLKQLVAASLEFEHCDRVAVVAFQNRQVWPLAGALGERMGEEVVCHLVSKKRSGDVPADVRASCTVVDSTAGIPPEARVVVSTCHRLGAPGEYGRLLNQFGTAANGDTPFDVMFVDEAWQLAQHLFARVRSLAPITVGVGDVGQLPPLEIGTNPWRGDPGYNPYRAWPTDYEKEPTAWSAELPTVWRPNAAQLPLWRAFYPEWKELDCVAAPGDRIVKLGDLAGVSEAVWSEVVKGTPVLLEVDGLEDAEAPDVDLPLMHFAEQLVDDLFSAGFSLAQAQYDGDGSPDGETIEFFPGDDVDDPLVTVLATRNQAVDDATEAAERIRERYDLTERDLIASTVDSWQGQTNGITVAIHPLTGAAELDAFNSAFGRLAVTCTRATHGLLVLSRPGLDQFLAESPAKPGSPIGEPGNRNLPRQTHQRILATFTRGSVRVDS